LSKASRDFKTKRYRITASLLVFFAQQNPYLEVFFLSVFIKLVVFAKGVFSPHNRKRAFIGGFENH
jgi:hypothetical protein